MPKRGLHPLKPLDIGVLLIAVALVAFAVTRAASSGDASTVRISDGSGEWLYPIGIDRSVNLVGPLGTTIVTIRDGSVWVESSPCKNQTCVAAAPITSPGQWTACLPNRVLVNVEGEIAKEKPDAIVR